MLEALLMVGKKSLPPIEPGWIKLTDVSFSRYYSHAQVVGNTICTSIGYANDITPAYDARTFTYVPAMDTWAAKAPCPVGRFDGCSAVLNGRFYVCGGRSPDYLKDLRSYDPVTNTWAQHADIPETRYRMSMATTGGKLYMFGGWTTVEMGDLYEYDPALSRWLKLAVAPFVRQKTSMVAIGTKLYIHGGPTEVASKELWCYDLASPTWVRLSDCPTPSVEFSMTVLDGLIYIYGGFNGTASPTTPRIYNPATNLWSTGLAGGPGGRLGCMAVVDKSFYLFSSLNAGGVGTKEVWRYTP